MSKKIYGKHKIFLHSILVVIFLLFVHVSVSAEFIKGEVVNVIDHGETEVFGETHIQQEIQVKYLSGSEKGTRTTISPDNMSVVTEAQKYKVGEKVVLQQTTDLLQIREKWRLPYVLIAFGLFFGIVLLITKTRGIFSILGLVFSVFLIAFFLIPGILHGKDPLLLSLITCILITGGSIYLSHGLKKRTHVSVISTFLVLIFSFGLAFASLPFTKLFGLGTEQAYYLFVGLGEIDLRGLLLGGIMLGTVGLLDDVTTTQCATVDEIQKAGKNLSFFELFKQGMSVGQEHIASMINTLALAYVGAGLPLFLLIAMNNDSPWWVILNSEFVVEEIIRTLVGSTALLLAVPISTALAAKVFGNTEGNTNE